MTTEKKPFRKFLKPCLYCKELIMSNEAYGVKDGIAFHKVCKEKAKEQKKEAETL